VESLTFLAGGRLQDMRTPFPWYCSATWRLIVLGGAVLLVGACEAPVTTVSPEPPPAGPVDPAAGTFVLTGDPVSSAGASWTYRERVDGVTYDLAGILRKPAGVGPFPAVIISHGFGGNARGYANNVGAEMVQWGLVVIATNYTHAAGAELGAPGLATERGASPANVLRARRLLALLRSLGYVDMTRVAAHGHSMGAFLTAALVGADPTAFRAASHTAGGVRIDGPQSEAAAPVDSQVAGITAPYQMHHGDNDNVVPLAMDQRLATLLASRGRRHELHVYPGGTHNDVPFSRQMYDHVRNWYRTYGVLAP
jgi:dienelactone hydrolase